MSQNILELYHVEKILTYLVKILDLRKSISKKIKFSNKADVKS